MKILPSYSKIIGSDSDAHEQGKENNDLEPLEAAASLTASDWHSVTDTK